MGSSPSAFIFQQKMNELLDDLEHVSAYLDDCLIYSKADFEDHLARIGQVLERLQKAGLRVNLNKSAFAKTEFKYLGYWVTQEGMRPLTSKVEAITAMKTPKTLKQLRSFLGMVNFYRDMWKGRSHILSPLTDLTKKDPKNPNNKSKIRDISKYWTETHTQSFEKVKEVISSETLLAFPDFTKPFHVHVDASDIQLGGVISQDNKPIAFYSRKLTPTQQNYTTSEREMLSVVETLKEYRNILLGQNIVVYTDHKNNTYPKTQYASKRIQRWRWVIEEFNPKLVYLKGEKNVVADALSRLERSDDVSLHKDRQTAVAERFDMVTVGKADSCPVSTPLIAEYQRNDKVLMQHLRERPQYFSKTVHGTPLVLFHKKIYIPKPLRKRILEWYHDALQHPGIARTERTIRQNFVWPGLSKDVERYVKSCHKCQLCKNPRTKYGHLTPRTFEEKPWDTLCVDCIGPYQVTDKKGNHYELKAMTMCDPASGWFEIVEIPNKGSETTALLVDRTWFSRYPRPQRCIFDNGNEFLGKEFQDMLKSYGIAPVPTTVKNPQANYVERVHQTLGNMIRTYEVDTEHEFDVDDPWSGILSNCAWAIRSTAHSVMNATPAQIIFGRDMLFDLSFRVPWEELRKRRLNAIETNTQAENRKRTKHTYTVGDLVLLDKGETVQRKLYPKRTGPYRVVRIYPNGILKITKGNYTQRVSLRRCIPYYSPTTELDGGE